jgi:nucleoid-associated protein YgaU
MNYGIWLSFNNQQEGFQIPVNPESIEVKDATDGKTYDILKLGEINVIKSPKLTEYEWSSFFPAQAYPFLATDLVLEPKQYVDYINKWKGTKRPIRFIYTSDTFDINEAVSIEEFQWKEVAGGKGDIEYTIRLKKYVFYAAKKVVVQQQATNKTVTTTKKPRLDDRVQPKTYTMKKGDTLWSIAKRYLGSGTRWREIAKLNNISDAEVRRLPVGKVLRLPG